MEQQLRCSPSLANRFRTGALCHRKGEKSLALLSKGRRGIGRRVWAGGVGEPLAGAGSAATGAGGLEVEAGTGLPDHSGALSATREVG